MRHSYQSLMSTWVNQTFNISMNILLLLPEFLTGKYCKFIKASISKIQRKYCQWQRINKTGFFLRKRFLESQKRKVKATINLLICCCTFSCTDSLCSVLLNIVNRSIIYTAPSSSMTFHRLSICVSHRYPEGGWSYLQLIPPPRLQQSPPNHIWTASPITRGFQHQDDKSSPVYPEAPKSLKLCLERDLKRMLSDARFYRQSLSFS